MSARPQLFRIEPSAAESKQMQEVDFARLGFQERRDIQEWVAANPGILGDDLLVIGKEFSGFDRTNERLDLLAVDQDGRLVVIELKRDDTGADAHWQAIKYASYLRRASVEHIVGMLANYRGVPEEDAANMLHQHIGADDLNALNNDQRIILASHRFAPGSDIGRPLAERTGPWRQPDYLHSIDTLPRRPDRLLVRSGKHDHTCAGRGRLHGRDRRIYAGRETIAKNIQQDQKRRIHPFPSEESGR